MISVVEVEEEQPLGDGLAAPAEEGYLAIQSIGGDLGEQRGYLYLRLGQQLDQVD